MVWPPKFYMWIYLCRPAAPPPPRRLGIFLEKNQLFSRILPSAPRAHACEAWQGLAIFVP